MTTSVATFALANKGEWGYACGYNSTKPRQLLRASTGFRANRVLGETAVTTTLASFAPNLADDVTHAVLCGACPEVKGEHYSCYAVSYESTDLDGEPAGERLFTCKVGLADSLEWAVVHNRSFVPPAISRLTPYCPACGAAWHACATDSRGLCVKASVAA